MRTIRLISIFAALFIACATHANAQSPRGQQPPPPPPAGPYKAVVITLPQAVSNPGFQALLKQLAEVAQRKDRAALAKLVVSEDFFWVRETGDRADKRKPGVDNLAAALGLNNKDGAGWDMLASFADDPTGSPSPEHKGAVCAPADPTFNGKAFGDLLKTTRTDVSDWGYPVSAYVEVYAAPKANAPVVDKLALAFVRIMPDSGPNVPAFLRITTPSGKSGFVSVESIAPLGNDQICYVEDASGWKIGGYIGGGDSQ